jgi:hypothetical protein
LDKKEKMARKLMKISILKEKWQEKQKIPKKKWQENSKLKIQNSQNQLQIGDSRQFYAPKTKNRSKAQKSKKQTQKPTKKRI